MYLTQVKKLLETRFLHGSDRITDQTDLLSGFPTYFRETQQKFFLVMYHQLSLFKSVRPQCQPYHRERVHLGEKATLTLGYSLQNSCI
jgi:hypothetical protein